ncbi:MAG: hypothetical protein ACK46X_11350 [Candidatus Sericytochromatia bacterium]
MGGASQNLREVYAQYFFSVFDASLHQDEAGRRMAQQHLEDTLVASGSVVPPEPAPSYAW